MNSEHKVMKAAQRTDRDMIAHWRRIGPELDRIWRQELREFNYKENFAFIDGLLELACEHGLPRTTSGLVELQRLFAKARR
jgi:hypothetical protein